MERWGWTPGILGSSDDFEFEVIRDSSVMRDLNDMGIGDGMYGNCGNNVTLMQCMFTNPALEFIW